MIRMMQCGKVVSVNFEPTDTISDIASVSRYKDYELCDVLKKIIENHDSMVDYNCGFEQEEE